MRSATPGGAPKDLTPPRKLRNILSAETRPGDLVLVMSNGSFDGLCGKLLGKLQERGAPAGKFKA